MLQVFFITQIIINIVKLFGYVFIVFWITLYINASKLLESKGENELLINFANLLNENILYVTAFVAFLEVLAHLFNFSDIISKYNKKINDYDEMKEKREKMEMELKFKNFKK